MRALVLPAALALLAGCADLDKLATVIPSPDVAGGTGIISPNGAGVVAQGAGNIISTNGGGAASTLFWVDPKEDLSVVFMTQLMPAGTFNFRGQLKNLIYSAIVD